MENAKNIKIINWYLKENIKNGEGKKYDMAGNVIFEGKYLNGKKWNLKNSYKSNDIIYELKERKGFIKECNYFTLNKKCLKVNI